MGVSDRIRAIVNDLNISQSKFARTLGVSCTYINLLINGKRECISQPLAILIQKIYGYSAEWILDEEGEMKKAVGRTLKPRSRLIAMVNTLTKEELDMVIDHVEYVEKESVRNITGENSYEKQEKRRKK